MSLFEDTNPHALKQLLASVHDRSMVLPDFQRDFVWDPGATQDLIVSIANNFPAGSLLRVRDATDVFACREFEGADRLNGKKHTFLVLDGQQRLTSLYQAFYGRGEHRYFLKVGEMCRGAEFEDAIFHERASSRRAKHLEDAAVQAKELVAPLSVLEGGSGRFSQWCRMTARRLPDAERIELEDSLAEVEDRWIKVIDDYQFPVVTLSADTTAAALCTIFETLNRTGVKLSVFELLAARFWPKEIRLREWWDKALSDYPLLEEFQVDPYYVMQGIELAANSAPSAKRTAVLNLTDAQVREWWGPVVVGMSQGLRILRDECNVLAPKWLPYQTMIPPLAGIMARHATKGTPASGVLRQRVVQWFWCSVFGQAYESSPNSRGAKDVLDFSSWMNGGQAVDAVRGFRFDPTILREVAPRQRALYRGTICLILGNRGGARDFHTQQLITSSLLESEGIDDHHLFPADFLRKEKSIDDSRLRDCVLNRTLIDRTTNLRISNRSPSDYLAEIRNTPGFAFDKVLESHTLPSDPDSPFWTNDYEQFLAWRQAELGAGIVRVTGGELGLGGGLDDH